MATTFRRTVRNSSLPCEPKEFAKLPEAEQAELLRGLSVIKAALLRGFRSVAEMRFHDAVAKQGLVFRYEDLAQKVEYVIPSRREKYLSDFFFVKKDGGTMFVDIKGEWDAKDREKFFLLKQQHPDMDLRIIFLSDPRTTWIGKRGGTSYADICTLGKGTGTWKTFSMPFAYKTMPPSWAAEIVTRR